MHNVVAKWFGCDRRNNAVTSVCDNSAIVDKGNKSDLVAMSNINVGLSPEFDIVRELQTTRDDADPRITFEHITGHQDTIQTTKKALSWKSQLNILCDQRAGDAHRVDLRVVHDLMPTKVARAVLCINNRAITTKHRVALTRAQWKPAIVAMLAKDHLPLAEKFDEIAWNASESARKKFSFCQHKFVTKCCYYYLPTQSELFKRRTTSSALCYGCGLPDEKNHFIQCSQPVLVQW